MGEKRARVVCVTGGGGFVASWLIKLLLSDGGYYVHATLRNPEDEKNDHLKQVEHAAAERLKIFKADLLDFESILAAIKGCEGVFHVASPVPPTSVPNPQVQVVEPALKGTLNVLKACSEAQVKRVVIVSSVAAIAMKPDLPKDQIMDETCWSDTQYCKTNNHWYCYSKTVAEAEALEYGKQNGLDVVTLCPTLVVGPMLQNTANSSSLALLNLLREGYEVLENNMRKLVDVRDVAEALRLLYEKREAEGRYICMAHMVEARDLVKILREIYPNYNYPKRFKEGTETSKVSSEKLQRQLGWKYRGLRQTLVDSVESYKLNKLLPCLPALLDS